MKTHTWTFALVAILALPATTPLAQDAPVKAPNPELVSQLAKELGSSNDQARGAAGSLFGLAKTRLAPADFAKVAGAVPGMDGLLAAAPAMAAVAPAKAGGAAGAAAALAGSGGLASLAGSFSKLGLKPDQIAKAASFLTQYVTKSGGAGVGSLLAGAFK
jgi:hypothetical protein